jgi:hypothetical protein
MKDIPVEACCNLLRKRRKAEIRVQNMRSDIETWSHSRRITDDKPIYKDVYGGSNIYEYIREKSGAKESV